MAVIAIGLLEPANLAVLFEMRKPQPDGAVIEKLMKRFIYTRRDHRRDADRDARDHDEAGELMAAAASASTSTPTRPAPPVTQLGMASIALVAGGVIYLAAYLPDRAPLAPGDRAARRGRARAGRERRAAQPAERLRVVALLPGRQVGAPRVHRDRRDDRVRVRLRPDARTACSS